MAALIRFHRDTPPERYEHPRLGVVELVVSARARRVSISVRASGDVRLTRPRAVSRRRALEFLDSRVDWVEQGVEAGRMVVVDRMAEFVEDDKVAQMLGQGHQIETQRDRIAARAAPPLRAGGTDRKARIVQPRLPGQVLDARRQVGVRGTAQRLGPGPLLSLIHISEPTRPY